MVRGLSARIHDIAEPSVTRSARTVHSQVPCSYAKRSAAGRSIPLSLVWVCAGRFAMQTQASLAEARSDLGWLVSLLWSFSIRFAVLIGQRSDVVGLPSVQKRKPGQDMRSMDRNNFRSPKEAEFITRILQALFSRTLCSINRLGKGQVLWVWLSETPEACAKRVLEKHPEGILHF